MPDDKECIFNLPPKLQMQWISLLKRSGKGNPIIPKKKPRLFHSKILDRKRRIVVKRDDHLNSHKEYFERPCGRHNDHLGKKKDITSSRD